jgi:hypothetical protein
LWWFFLMPTTACIAGLLVFQLSGPSNEANEKAAKATAEASSEKMLAAASADADNPKSMLEKNSGLQNMTEQPTDPGNNSVTNPELNAAVPQKAVYAAPQQPRLNACRKFQQCWPKRLLLQLQSWMRRRLLTLSKK